MSQETRPYVDRTRHPLCVCHLPCRPPSTPHPNPSTPHPIHPLLSLPLNLFNQPPSPASHQSPGRSQPGATKAFTPLLPVNTTHRHHWVIPAESLFSSPAGGHPRSRRRPVSQPTLNPHSLTGGKRHLVPLEPRRKPSSKEVFLKKQ